MVEELIAEGMSPAEIASLLVAEYGMNEGDANLAVNTALGGQGDRIDTAVVAAARPDVSELAMIAVYPRAEEQVALAELGTHASDTMHVTLVFLGEAAGLDDDAIEETLADIGRVVGPLEGSVGGIGRFAPGPDGVPVIALPSVKGLAELRAVIADALEDQGIVSPTEHGWTPHLTIDYADDASAELPGVPDVPLHFDTISFTKGDVRRDFPLEGELVASMLEDANDWSGTAAGWEGGTELAVVEVAEPVEVVAAVEPAGVGALVDAVIGGIGRQFADLIAAMTAMGNRPVEIQVPQEITAALTVPPPTIVVNVPEQAAPVVNVTVPEAAPPQVTVNVPEQPAPVVNVEAAAAPVVNVPAPNVSVTVEQPDGQPDRKVTFQRDEYGRIVSAEVEDEPEG